MGDEPLCTLYMCIATQTQINQWTKIVWRNPNDGRN
jgi:hypothetical protein